MCETIVCIFIKKLYFSSSLFSLLCSNVTILSNWTTKPHWLYMHKTTKRNGWHIKGILHCAYKWTSISQSRLRWKWESEKLKMKTKQAAQAHTVNSHHEILKCHHHTNQQYINEFNNNLLFFTLHVVRWIS